MGQSLDQRQRTAIYNAARTSGAVSYTHLDVYKRQAKIRVKIFLAEILSSMVYTGAIKQQEAMIFMIKKQAHLLLLAAGVLMLLFGVWRGEADTVFSKAIRLCMECVGIG